MARQMEAVHKDLSSEKPGSDGTSERAEGSEPQATSLTRQTDTTRRKRLKRLETEIREETQAKIQ